MLIKLDQNLKWRNFRSKKRLVKAVKMREDFLLETSLGYVEGKRGDWVVEMGHKIRFPCDERVFLKSYHPLENDNASPWRRCDDEMV